MDWNILIEVAKIVGGVIVSIAAIWKVAPRIWGKVVGWFMHDLQEQICNISKEVGFIASELRTNDGSSLRDLALRTDAAIHRVERMSWNNNEVQRARMDNDPQLIFITDAVGDCEWVNRAYMRHSGRVMEELKGSGWINVIKESQREAVKDSWYEASREGREFQMTVTYKTPEGHEFDVEIHSYKLTDPGGDVVIGYLGAGTIV